MRHLWTAGIESGARVDACARCHLRRRHQAKKKGSIFADAGGVTYWDTQAEAWIKKAPACRDLHQPALFGARLDEFVSLPVAAPEAAPPPKPACTVLVQKLPVIPPAAFRLSPAKYAGGFSYEILTDSNFEVVLDAEPYEEFSVVVTAGSGLLFASLRKFSPRSKMGTTVRKCMQAVGPFARRAAIELENLKSGVSERWVCDGKEWKKVPCTT